MVVAELLVKIGVDVSALASGVSEANKSLGKMGTQLAGIGQSMSTLVTLPLIAAAGAAVKLASDAEESASKMEAVFGSATAEVNQQLATLQATIPATTKEMQDMASGIQDLLVPLGLAPAAAQDMTLEVVKLAGDLASFNNIPMAEALERIRSGLVGQNEPLLKFGVALSAATVKAKALELGLISEGEEINANARAQAAFQLILEGTTAAHGDAARTAESVANQMKFLKSEALEVATNFGTLLLPAATEVIGMMTEGVAVIARMVEGWNNLTPATQKFLGIVAGLVTAIGPLLLVGGKLLTLIAGLNPVVALAVVAFGSIVAAGVAITENWNVLSFEAKRLADFVTAQFQRLVDVFNIVQEGTLKVVGFFQDMFDVVVGHSIVPDLIEAVQGEFGRLDVVMAGAAQKAVATTNAAFANIVNPKALRAMDFNVTLNAEQLYEAVIRGGETAAEALTIFSFRTELAGSITEDFSASLVENLTVAQRLADAHRDMEVAEQKAAEQAEIMAQTVGLVPLPTRAMTEEMLKAHTGLRDLNIEVPKLTASVSEAVPQTSRVFSALSDVGGTLVGGLKGFGGGLLDVLAKFSPMGLAAETLSRVFNELEPAIKAIEPIVVVLAKAIAAGLLPILKILFPVIKFIGVAFTFAGEIVYRVAQGFLFIIGNVVKAIGKLIDSLPFVSGKGIIEAGENLLDQADAMGDAAAAMRDAREELRDLQWPVEEEAVARDTLAACEEGFTANRELLGELIATVREKEWNPQITITVAPGGGGGAVTGGAGTGSGAGTAEWVDQELERQRQRRAQVGAGDMSLAII